MDQRLYSKLYRAVARRAIALPALSGRGFMKPGAEPRVPSIQRVGRSQEAIVCLINPPLTRALPAMRSFGSLGKVYWRSVLSCPECSQKHDRASRVEACEKTLLLFMETFSKLARQIADIEHEADRIRHEGNPPPPGAEPIPKKRFLLVPAELIAGLAPPLDDEATPSREKPSDRPDYTSLASPSAL